MSTHEHSLRAHELVDAIKGGYTPDCADVDFLRSFLPELPKQKTLEEITELVNEAWGDAHVNEWDASSHGPLEGWLSDLEMQLRGLANTKPARPEFLETEEDYQNAPNGTVVGKDGWLVWLKQKNGRWACDGGHEEDSTLAQSGRRRVLRWGWGK